MIWILDGYNVIHAHPALEKKLDANLELARYALIEICETLIKSHGDFQRIFVVFDGKSEFADLPRYQSRGLEIVYTDTEEDADDRIIEILEHLGPEKQATVVSNDNYVMNNARVYRARKMSVQAFFELYDNHRIKREKLPNKTPASQKISGAVAQDITDEYKKHLGL